MAASVVIDVPGKMLIRTALAFLLVGVPGWGWSVPDCDNPRRLNFAVVPESGSARDLKRFAPLLARISRASGKPVDTVPASSYGAVIEGLTSGAIDFAMLGPASYVKARRADSGIDPIATMTRQAGAFHEGGQFYRSLLVMRQDAPARTLQEMKGVTLAMVDPNSTSGAIIPRRQLGQQAGIAFEQHFGRIVYTGAHPKSIQAVADRKVGAAFVSSTLLAEFIQSGKAQEGDFRVIWRSAPIPGDPVVLRSRLCRQVVDVIRAQLLEVSPEKNRDVLRAFGASRFLPASDADYDILRPLVP